MSYVKQVKSDDIGEESSDILRFEPKAKVYQEASNGNVCLAEQLRPRHGFHEDLQSSET